ncbi:MAG: hypothetical protein K2K81_03195 [Muribaculaceae bacterium]|nr:hypothetical protein [Muribaculaceae bacterium]
MTKEYKYLKEGVTADLIEFLIQDYDLDLQTALNALYESETYSKLNDSATGLYFQSSRYVYSFLQEELQKGRFN